MNSDNREDAGIARNNLSSLIVAVASRIGPRSVSRLHVCPARAHDNFCGPAAQHGRRLAVLISGHPRTMTASDVIASYSSLMTLAKTQQWEPHVFAFLDFQTSEASLREALNAWRVPYTLRQRRADHTPSGHRCGDSRARRACWPGVPSSTSSQLTKVAAAMQMMLHAEARDGVPFDLVLRARPDLCVQRAFNLLSTVLRHASRCMPLVLSWHDGLAIVPRWAAEAFGALWRPSDCPGPISTAGRAGLRNGSAHWSLGPGNAWLQIGGRLAALGIAGVELLDFSCSKPTNRRDAPFPRRVSDMPRCHDRLAVRRAHVGWEGFEQQSKAGGFHRTVPVVGHCAFFL